MVNKKIIFLENFFNISWQNDQTPMALGEVLNQRAIKSLYVLAPNYAAGKDMVAGVERTFKGKVVGKDMTTWPTQIDWSAEFTKVKAAKPIKVRRNIESEKELLWIKKSKVKIPTNQLKKVKIKNNL